jgi:sec-independent protein translocase protein TatA
MRLGWGELLIIFAILVLIFGAKRLPEFARAVGESIRELQRSMRGHDKKDDESKPS